MRQLSKKTGALNLEVQSENEAQPEFNSPPRTTKARRSIGEEAWSMRPLCLKNRGLLNLIVKCEVQSGTKALPSGLSPEEAPMSHRKLSEFKANWDNLHLF